MTVVVLLFVVAAPTCLMPLFNKFEKIKKNLLRRDIYRLANEVDYPLSKIEIVDGSTRSSHSNAFQYGFGKIKKIVVFDTLLKDHLGFTDEAKEARKDELKTEGDSNTVQAEEDDAAKEPLLGEDGQPKKPEPYKQDEFLYTNKEGRLEIIAIVAHELGHWAHMDSLKNIIFVLFQIYLIFGGFGYSIEYANMVEDFNFIPTLDLGNDKCKIPESSMFLKLYIFTMILSPISYVLEHIQIQMVRTAEYAADRYSIEQGYGPQLKAGLIKLFKKNMGALTTDRLYAFLKHSHPHLEIRLEAIDNEMKNYLKKKSISFEDDQFESTYVNTFAEKLAARHDGEDFDADDKDSDEGMEAMDAAEGG